MSVFFLWLLFDSYAHRENSFSLFVSDVRLGSSKISPSSSPLRLTSLFHHSAALSRLLWPCLVTAHLCHGAIQSHWWPRGANESKWQNGTVLHKHTFPFKPGVHNAHYVKATGRTAVRTFRHGILRIRKCVWWPLVAVSFTSTHNVCSQPAWKWSKVLLLCNCAAHTALICSLAGENKPRGLLKS